MQRGTATVVLVLGAMALAVGLWLATSTVDSGSTSCGSVLSPDTDSWDPALSDAENFLNGATADQRCSEEVAGRGWLAAVVGLAGVGGLVMAGRALNATAYRPPPDAERT